MTEPISIVAGLKAVGTLAAGKKIGMGAIAAVTMMNDEVKSAWPLITVLLIPLITAAYYAGQLVKQMDGMQKSIVAQFEQRDFKIDYSYKNAIQGDRFTASDAKVLRELVDNRWGNIRDRVSELEHDIKDSQDGIAVINKKTSNIEVKLLAPSRFVKEGERLEHRILMLEGKEK